MSCVGLTISFHGAVRLPDVTSRQRHIDVITATSRRDSAAAADDDVNDDDEDDFDETAATSSRRAAPVSYLRHARLTSWHRDDVTRDDVTTVTSRSTEHLSDDVGLHTASAERTNSQRPQRDAPRTQSHQDSGHCTRSVGRFTGCQTIDNVGRFCLLVKLSDFIVQHRTRSILDDKIGKILSISVTMVTVYCDG